MSAHEEAQVRAALFRMLNNHSTDTLRRMLASEPEPDPRASPRVPTLETTLRFPYDTDDIPINLDFEFDEGFTDEAIHSTMVSLEGSVRRAVRREKQTPCIEVVVTVPGKDPVGLTLSFPQGLNDSAIRSVAATIDGALRHALK